MHILIAEDNKSLLVSMSLGLKELGLEVDVASSLDATLAKAKRIKYDVILLDMSLPDSQGLVTYFKVRAEAPRTPIVLFTGPEEEDLALAAVEAGAQGHVSKETVSDEAVLRRLEYAVERYEIEQALKVSEKRLRIILENSYDAFISTDSNWNITDWNRQAEITFGWTKHEALGRPLSSVVPRHLRRQYAKQVEQHFENSRGSVLRANYEFLAVNQAGLEFPIEFVVFKIKEDLDYLYCAFIRDLSQSKRLSEGLERIVAERTERLTQSNEELRQFAKIASHDLQEPLRAVQGFASLLAENAREKLDSDSQEFIDYILDGTKRMQALIQAVLTHSSITSEQHNDYATGCDTVIKDVLANLSATIKDSGAHFEIEHLPEVAVERSHLLQLFQNLISNSLKYRSDQTPQIFINADRSGDMWLFSVRDNGIGIDPKYSDKIFDMFARLHGKTEYSGTGMGLAICKRIVTSHGGTISVESEPGQGSIFLFTLPAVVESSTQEEEQFADEKHH